MGRELQKIWNIKVKIIPLVVGSLDIIPRQFGNRLKQIGITVGTAQVQKTVLLQVLQFFKNFYSYPKESMKVMFTGENDEELLNIWWHCKEDDLEICGHDSLPLTFASNSLCAHFRRDYQDDQVLLECTVCD